MLAQVDVFTHTANAQNTHRNTKGNKEEKREIKVAALTW